MSSHTKAKTVQLLLYDGDLSGVINIADSAWNPGEMYASPRESVNELVSLDKYGVYLLLSSDRVYVGQASDLERRIKQHLSGKDWWERVVLLTTQDDSFTRTDIDYLESVLIEKAAKTKSLDTDNRNKGNNPKIDKFRKVTLDQYLDEALFLMELIGITVFCDVRKGGNLKKRKTSITITSPIITSKSEIPKLPSDTLKVGEYVKTAMRNLKDSGFLFTEEQIALYSSVEGSKMYTTRDLPMFLLLEDGETRDSIKEQKNTKRYWKEEYVFGKYRFLMYSQWYEERSHGATRKEFVDWYKTL